MASHDAPPGVRRKVSRLREQKRFRWVDRFEMTPVSDGFDEHGVDVQVVVRSGVTDVFEDAERLDELVASVSAIFFAETELYPYVTFVSADELAA